MSSSKKLPCKGTLPQVFILAHRSTGPQSRQSARLSLQSSELGPQPLNPQVSVSPPLVPGGDALACRRGGGWGPNIGGQTKKFKKEADRTFRCASPIFMTITY